MKIFLCLFIFVASYSLVTVMWLGISFVLFLVKNSCKEVLIFVHVNLSNIYIYIFIYLHVQFFCAQVECHFNQRSCLVEMIQALSPIHCRLTGILLSSYGII